MVGLDGNPISYRKSTDQYGFWCLCVFMRLCRYAIEIRANVWSGWAFYIGINIAIVHLHTILCRPMVITSVESRETLM